MVLMSVMFALLAASPDGGCQPAASGEKAIDRGGVDYVRDK
jgi:hypothetical protein